jgi:hypothetical protein
MTRTRRCETWCAHAPRRSRITAPSASRWVRFCYGMAGPSGLEGTASYAGCIRRTSFIPLSEWRTGDVECGACGSRVDRPAGRHAAGDDPDPDNGTRRRCLPIHHRWLPKPVTSAVSSIRGTIWRFSAGSRASVPPGKHGAKEASPRQEISAPQGIDRSGMDLSPPGRHRRCAPMSPDTAAATGSRYCLEGGGPFVRAISATDGQGQQDNRRHHSDRARDRSISVAATPSAAAAARKRSGAGLPRGTSRWDIAKHVEPVPVPSPT